MHILPCIVNLQVYKVNFNTLFLPKSSRRMFIIYSNEANLKLFLTLMMNFKNNPPVATKPSKNTAPKAFIVRYSN